jgi:bifunctional oligoribonuclease and PAP phosphatase NrnA
MVDELKALVESSQRILITSHTSPDADAVCSVLLLGQCLKANYPSKQVRMTLEEQPDDLSFLNGFEEIGFMDTLDSLTQFSPDLLIILDGNNYERVSRHDGAAVRDYISLNDVRTAVIDHHEPAGREEVDVYINHYSPATVQDVYELCFKEFQLAKPDGYAQTAMVGLYSDTGGFTYIDKRPDDTLRMIGELIKDGANIEKIRNALEQFTDEDMAVFGELSTNLIPSGNFSYSFIRDEFVKQWLADGKSGEQLHGGVDLFVNRFIRNISNRQWGFVVYKNVLQGDNIYSVSFRAVGTVMDVAAIANKLGGGGHKPAAGAKFSAASVEEAIRKVQQAIAEN